jgi:hypothetical protein
MSDSWLDHIPSREREKIRQRLRSPEAYEALREKVKGPEDVERELERSALLAELRFGLETEPHLHDALKSAVERDLREKGVEQMLEATSASVDARRALEQGKFLVKVEAHPVTHVDQLVLVADSGNVQEKLPLRPSVSEQYVSQFAKV